MLFRISVLLICVALSAAGCTRPSSTEARETAQAALREACPMSLHEVYTTGNPAKRPFIRPEHISSITPAPVNHSGEAAAMLVRLTTEGEEIMLRFSQDAVGEEIAVFCEDDEISRATIISPFANDFRVVIPAPTDGT